MNDSFQFAYTSAPAGQPSKEFHFNVQGPTEEAAAASLSAYLADVSAQHTAANGTDGTVVAPRVRKPAAKKAATKPAK